MLLVELAAYLIRFLVTLFFSSCLFQNMGPLYFFSIQLVKSDSVAGLLQTCRSSSPVWLLPKKEENSIASLEKLEIHLCWEGLSESEVGGSYKGQGGL